jgi:ABC-2 type transport system ATP-binding protein
VIFLRNGRLIATEDVADLKARSLHIIEATFSQAPPSDAFNLPGVKEIERFDSTVHLEVYDQLDAALKAISRYRVLDLRTEQPSLEQVFLAYYGGNHGRP